MNKRAEEAALKAYPDDKFVDAEYSSMCRGFYQEGYEQAEKDLTLTWEDIRILFKIADSYESELNRPKYLTEAYCQEILKRFNEQRKK